MSKRNLSDESLSLLPATRRKLEHHTSHTFEPTALAVTSRNDLDDKTLDRVEDITRKCDTVKQIIAVVGSNSPLLYNIVEPLLQRIAVQVGNDDPLLVVNRLLADGSETRAELLKLTLKGMDQGFATLRRLEILQPNYAHKQVDYPPQKPATLVFVDRNDLDDQELDKNADIQMFVNHLKKFPPVDINADINARLLQPALVVFNYLVRTLAAQVGHEDPPLVAKNIFKDESPDRTAVMKLLMEGVDVGFARARRLKILQSRDFLINNSGSNMPIVTDEVDAGWNAEYMGTRHKLLLKNICAMYTSPATNIYRNQVAIIQSSGTGKSRMVHEMSKLVFTIPLNLRIDEATLKNAYPLPDSDVRDLLIKGCGDMPTEMTYLLFLRWTFENVEKVLSQLEDLEPKTRTRFSVAKLWADTLMTFERRQLYKAVIRDVRHAAEKKPLSSMAACIADVVHAFRSLLDSLQMIYVKSDVNKERPIEVVLYVDEAHVLDEPSYCGRESLYEIFCDSVACLSSEPFFVVFISTTPAVAPLKVEEAAARSRRTIPIHRSVPQAPITETPFDCFFPAQDTYLLNSDNYHPLAGRIKPGKLTTKDVSKITFMARFGRPLFWALLSSAMHLENDVLNMACKKLMCAQSYNPFLCNEARLAILDVVLSLKYEDRQGIVNTTLSTMVASHMRIAYSIPVHRQYMESGYPSEPILAEAASRQLWHMWKEPDGNFALRVLKYNVDNCILDRGELRGLLGRKLLTYAYQRAVKKVETASFSDGCQLIDMIDELFASPYAEVVLDSTPDNITLPKGCKPTSFKEAFGNAMIRFTHFVKMGDINGVATDVLWAAYIRGMAFILPKNQNGIDVIIPVLLYDCLICKHVMTGILIQFKQQYSIHENTFRLFGEWENCEHNNVSHIRPYTTLIMDLGATRHFMKEEMAPKKSKKSTMKSPKEIITIPSIMPFLQDSAILANNISSKQQLGGTSMTAKENGCFTTHPRYQIFAYGCSSTVYKVIDAIDEPTYTHLLVNNEFFPEHPRQDTESISAVMQMKSVFHNGDNSYNWVEPPPLTPAETNVIPVEEKEAEGVKVGTSICNL